MLIPQTKKILVKKKSTKPEPTIIKTKPSRPTIQFKQIGGKWHLELMYAGRPCCIEVPDLSSPSGMTCSDLGSCPIIVNIQSDITDLESNISTLLPRITAVENATTLESLQDAISSLFTHANHTNITATYDDVLGQVILVGQPGGGGGSTFTCTDVSVCIGGNTATQTALLNWLQTTPNVTVSGVWVFNNDVTFQDHDVNFNNSDVNIGTGSTVNYDNTVVSNHNGDVSNYIAADINYDSTTVITGGVYESPTINNPTFTGSYPTAKWKNVSLAGQSSGSTYTLSDAPSGDIQVSVVGGVIQVETGDYTHADNANTFVGNIDLTGYTLAVTYIYY